MCPSSGGRGGNDMIWMKKAMALCLALLLVCGAAWAEQENNDRVLAVVNGVQVSVDEVEREFQDNAAFYRESGQSDAEINKLKEELARECVMNELLRQKAAELGLDRFSEEELASYRADAENQYDNMLTYYMDYFADDSLTEDEVREQTVAYFTESGYTVDSILSQQLRDAAQDRLYEQITQTVEMTEDELQAYYDQRVAADRQEFTENVYAFEYALSGESVVTYVPAGFRAVRALLVNARRLLKTPKDLDARSEIQWPASIAHNNLLDTGREADWGSHRIEHELSAQYGLTHGEGMAVVLPAWVRYAAANRPEKPAQLAARVFGYDYVNDSPGDMALGLADELERFFRSMKLRTRLSELQIGEDDFETMALRATKGDTAAVGHYIPLNCARILEILKLAR